jgi:hypothetical protein
MGQHPWVCARTLELQLFAVAGEPVASVLKLPRYLEAEWPDIVVKAFRVDAVTATSSSLLDERVVDIEQVVRRERLDERVPEEKLSRHWNHRRKGTSKTTGTTSEIYGANPSSVSRQR